MLYKSIKYLAFLATTCLMVGGAVAQSDSDRNAFAFGGRYTSQYVEHALNPFTVAYENNYVVGGGYQQFFFNHDWNFFNRDWGMRIGAEVGAALRMGNQTSTELWVGPVLRLDDLIQTDFFRVSASITGGLSLTSDTIGIERQREIETNGDTTLLYYMGPELIVSGVDNDVEFFWRLHHRSGGGGTLGGLQDAANATALGVRWNF